MLRILALIVFSIVAYAKEIPLMQNIDIYLPVKGFSVIEFPFKVQSKKFGPFVYYKKKNEEDAESLNNVETPKISKIRTIRDVKKISFKNKNTKSPIKATSSDNMIQFYATIEGETELVIYGYEKYPIILKLIFTNDKTLANRYVKFIDYKKESEVQNVFKGATHEKICTKLVYYLFNNTTPPGFKVLSPYQQYDTNGLRFVLVKEYLGKNYSAIEYRVTNKDNKKRFLDETLFASDQVYAVSILNRELKPNETTRLFLVTKAQKAEVENNER